MIKIILAEDHLIVRNGIKMLLEAVPEIEIVGIADNGQEVLDLLQQGVVADILLTDINMPIMDGITLLKELQQQKNPIKAVVLSMLDMEQYVIQTFNEGAWGYVLKSADQAELIFCIKTVYSGARYLSVELTNKLLDKLLHGARLTETKSANKVDLSSREIEVLHLMAEGFTNLEMADRLYLSKRTIEGHRQALLEKTGSKNTAALIRYSIQSGLL